MRPVFLTVFGILLLLIKSVAVRAFHIELLHPDLGLLMAVFVAFHLRPFPGLMVVFVLGLFTDSIGGTPLGMKALIDLTMFFIVRLSLRVLLPDRLMTQFVLLFLASIVSSLVLVIVLIEVGPGVITPVIYWMVPLALLNTILGIPIWAVARQISGPPIMRSAFSFR
jgi:rod shape-determining protein MreD